MTEAELAAIEARAVARYRDEFDTPIPWKAVQDDVPALLAEVRRLRDGRRAMEDYIANAARHRRGCPRARCRRATCASCVCSCGLDAAIAAVLGVGAHWGTG